jgi:hypothetical protein
MLLLMTDTIMKKFGSMVKDLTIHIETLKAENTHIRTGLQNLLNEDDVQNVPAYELLKSVYSEYLTAPVPAVKIKTKDADNLDDQYDPLYSPMGTRKRTNAASRKKYEATCASIAETVKNAGPKRTAASVSTDAPSALGMAVVKMHERNISAKSFSNDVPDFGIDLLTEMAPAQNPKPKSKPKSKVIIIDVTKPNTVYRIEIQGKEYYRHDKYLYDTVTQLRVGSVEEECFVIAGKSIMIADDTSTRVQVQYIDGDMYKDNTGKIYTQVNDSVYQAIGEFDGEEIGLWQ